MAVAIRAEGLGRKFGDRVAVEGLTVEVAQGEVLGFLGPNGAGKTTTVRMLAALIAPTAGEAEIVGFRLGRDDDAIRRHVGILTESPGLYDRLGTARNLEIFARLQEVPDPAAQVERYLRQFGLWERRDDPAAQLSKGMRQKLAIARALLHEPPVLFLDEPTSGLDPEAAKVVRDAIAGLKTEGRTIWLCTHNLGEAERLCDRIAVFRTSVLAIDTVTALRARAAARKVTIRLRSPSSDHDVAVRALPGVVSVERTERGLVLEVDDPEARVPTVVRALVSAGADVLEVVEAGPSLEEVYFQVVGGAA